MNLGGQGTEPHPHSHPPAYENGQKDPKQGEELLKMWQHEASLGVQLTTHYYLNCAQC